MGKRNGFPGTRKVIEVVTCDLEMGDVYMSLGARGESQERWNHEIKLQKQTESKSGEPDPSREF